MIRIAHNNKKKRRNVKEHNLAPWHFEFGHIVTKLRQNVKFRFWGPLQATKNVRYNFYKVHSRWNELTYIDGKWVSQLDTQLPWSQNAALKLPTLWGNCQLARDVARESARQIQMWPNVRQKPEDRATQEKENVGEMEVIDREMEQLFEDNKEATEQLSKWYA